MKHEKGLSQLNQFGWQVANTVGTVADCLKLFLNELGVCISFIKVRMEYP